MRRSFGTSKSSSTYQRTPTAFSTSRSSPIKARSVQYCGCQMSRASLYFLHSLRLPQPFLIERVFRGLRLYPPKLCNRGGSGIYSFWDLSNRLLLSDFRGQLQRLIPRFVIKGMRRVSDKSRRLSELICPESVLQLLFGEQRYPVLLTLTCGTYPDHQRRFRGVRRIPIRWWECSDGFPRVA